MDLDGISVEVAYLGAAPEEVEEAVNVRIEEAIQGIDGIKQIQSTASEGMGTVMIEMQMGADARRVVDEVKSNIDAITTFPVETEKPIIRELTNRQQVVDIAVSGNIDLFTLKRITERVRDELTAIPEITQVDIVSAPPYEISIEVSEDDLRRHGLTFDQVADAVRRSSLDLPGGSVRTERGEILLRTHRAGLPRGGVRGSGPLDAGRRQPPPPRRRGDRRRRLRGDRPVRAVRRRADDDGLGIPDRGSERDRARRSHQRVCRGGAGAPARRGLAHGLAGLGQDPGAPRVADAPDRLRGVRAGVPGARPVPGAAAGRLGQRWHPDLVPRGHRADAGPRRLRQRDIALRVRYRDRDRRRRRHRRRRERLPAPRGARRRHPRCHRRRLRDRQAGDLRRPHGGGRLQSAAVRAGHDGQALPGRPADRHPVPAVLAARVAEHPAGPSVAHPEARPQWAVAPVPVDVREGPEAIRAEGLLPRPRSGAPLALPDGVDRRRHHARHPRHGAVGPAGIPVLPADRSGIHSGLGDDAAGHADRRHRGGGREDRGGCGAGPAAAARRDRPGLLPAFVGHRRRPADGGAGRRSLWRGGRPRVVECRRGGGRAAPDGAAHLQQRAARSPLA